MMTWVVRGTMISGEEIVIMVAEMDISNINVVILMEIGVDTIVDGVVRITTTVMQVME